MIVYEKLFESFFGNQILAEIKKNILATIMSLSWILFQQDIVVVLVSSMSQIALTVSFVEK